MPLDPKQVPLGFWHPFPSKCLHVDLFYTSGRISLEYRALVYSKLAFDLTTHSLAHTARFLDQIGENAQDIRHSAQILDKVQSACTGLTKVTFGPVCAFDGRVSPYLESPEKTSNLFRMVNERLQAFPSLWSITIVIPVSDAYRRISDELKNCYGWKVIEEEDWSQDGWSPRRINRNNGGQGYNGHSRQFVSGILAGIGAGNRPRLRNTDHGEMDEGSSGSSHDTGEDSYDRNTGRFDSVSDDESIQGDGSSNTTVNTGSTGDGLHIDGSDEGFDETENPELYAYYQLGRLP
ncbi:hypothetical protein DPV78_003601 [Talaromyces pinophilus]|nr:hypothetical protein DPV78_003601 [Talaromyces pinophilus]